MGSPVLQLDGLSKMAWIFAYWRVEPKSSFKHRIPHRSALNLPPLPPKNTIHNTLENPPILQSQFGLEVWCGETICVHYRELWNINPCADVLIIIGEELYCCSPTPWGHCKPHLASPPHQQFHQIALLCFYVCVCVKLRLNFSASACVLIRGEMACAISHATWQHTTKDTPQRAHSQSWLP